LIQKGKRWLQRRQLDKVRRVFGDMKPRPSAGKKICSDSGALSLRGDRVDHTAVPPLEAPMSVQLPLPGRLGQFRASESTI